MITHCRATATVQVVMISLILCVSSALGYEIETHALISETAINGTNVDQTLRESLGILEGINKVVANLALLDWLEEGSKREDNGTRFFNHFHDPLVDWWQAGYKGSLAQSAILWGQNLNQCSAPDPSQCVPNWAWQNARQFYLDALTKPQESDRDAALANTFQALGRQIHLIQDAASPAHTRNDTHWFYNYETLVDDVRLNDRNTFNSWLANSAPGFTGQPDPGWQSLPANSLAPIPIARLLDTDLYAGNNPSATMNSLMGLSEYTNANYFSEDTIFAENKTSGLDRFPYPARTSVSTPRAEAIRLKTGETVNRFYYWKDFDGDTGYRLSTVSFLRNYIQLFNLTAGRREKTALDDTVYRGYAERLVPRAVGYSAALLDYFFRGRLEIAAPDRFLYGRTNYQDPLQTIDPGNNVNVFTQLRFKVRNVTPGETTSCPAGQQCAARQLFAVVRYRSGGDADLIQTPGAPISAEVYSAVSQPLTLAPTLNLQDFQELTFDFSGSPLPANVADVFLTVVYRGPLGLEVDAVMVGGKDLFESTPVVLVNGTDYSCWGGALKHVSDFTAFPPFVSSQQTPERDPSGDGVQDLFGPEDQSGVYVKAGGTVPSANNYDQQITHTSFGQVTRFLVLQDQPAFAVWTISNMTELGTASEPVSQGYRIGVTYPANYNRVVVDSEGNLGRQWIDSFLYRGLTTTQLAVVVAQDWASFQPCLAESFSKEALTLIESTLAGP